MAEPRIPMDEPSVFFAHLLENIVVEEQEDTPLRLVCQTCQVIVCDIEDSDSVRTLLNTALQHRC